MFRSGYVAIVGSPNVGKSTLLNAILDQKIAAVSPKPQTTRHRILGIKTTDQAQILFLDTPGIHKPHRSLNEYMMEIAHATFDDADLFLFVLEPFRNPSETEKEIYEKLLSKNKPILLVVNKAEQVKPEQLGLVVQKCRELFQATALVSISALNRIGLVELERVIVPLLPEGPPYYPADQVTDQTERVLVAETIREKIMELTRQEVPYSVAVLIEKFQEPEDSETPQKKNTKRITRIRAAIVVEKDSQKIILVGKAGAMIKKIGETSRKEIEALLGNQVFLELFVRVEKEWTRNALKVREFETNS